MFFPYPKTETVTCFVFFLILLHGNWKCFVRFFVTILVLKENARTVLKIARNHASSALVPDSDATHPGRREANEGLPCLSGKSVWRSELSRKSGFSRSFTHGTSRHACASFKKKKVSLGPYHLPLMCLHSPWPDNENDHREIFPLACSTPLT